MESTAADSDITIPTWLNNDFLSEVLSKEENIEISVTDFTANPAVPKGNSYLSTLYRIVAQYKRGKKEEDTSNYFIIVKTLPESEYMKNFLAELDGFEKEECMYKKVFPFIYKTMKSVTGNIHFLSPRCLPCSVEKTLVLEDLQPLGYKMADRKIGLDLDHCKLAVKAFARLHAYSIAMYKSDPDIMNNFQDKFYTKPEEKRKDVEYHFDVHLKAFASEVENWPGFEHYAEKIRNLIPKAIDLMRESVLPKKDSLNVLTHGDCWTNNMLFHYSPDTGKVDDIRLVDFQITRFGSPALDLQYFMCFCPNDDVRFDHRETLLEEYHSEFCKTLKILKLDPDVFTLQQLKDEFVEKDIFGLYTACTILAAIIADESAAPDLKDITVDNFQESGENFLAIIFTGKRFRKVMEKLLPFYEQKGLL